MTYSYILREYIAKQNVSGIAETRYIWEGESSYALLGFGFMGDYLYDSAASDGSDNPRLIRDVKIGEVLCIGPYRVIVTDAKHYGEFEVRRLNGRASIWLLSKWIRGRYLLKLINRRLKLTAYIWGLTNTHEALEVQWKDLRPYQWLRGWLQRSRDNMRKPDEPDTSR